MSKRGKRFLNIDWKALTQSRDEDLPVQPQNKLIKGFRILTDEENRRNMFLTVIFIFLAAVFIGGFAMIELEMYSAAYILFGSAFFITMTFLRPLSKLWYDRYSDKYNNIRTLGCSIIAGITVMLILISNLKFPLIALFGSIETLLMALTLTSLIFILCSACAHSIITRTTNPTKAKRWGWVEALFLILAIAPWFILVDKTL